MHRAAALACLVSVEVGCLPGSGRAASTRVPSLGPVALGGAILLLAGGGLPRAAGAGRSTPPSG